MLNNSILFKSGRLVYNSKRLETDGAAAHALKSTIGYFTTLSWSDTKNSVKLNIPSTKPYSVHGIKIDYDLVTDTSLKSDCIAITTGFNSNAGAYPALFNGQIALFDGLGRPSLTSLMSQWHNVIKTDVTNLTEPYTPLVWSGRYGFTIEGWPTTLLKSLLDIAKKGDGSIVDFSWIGFLIEELDRRAVAKLEEKKGMKKKVALIKNKTAINKTVKPKPTYGAAKYYTFGTSGNLEMHESDPNPQPKTKIPSLEEAIKTAYKEVTLDHTEEDINLDFLD